MAVIPSRPRPRALALTVALALALGACTAEPPPPLPILELRGLTRWPPSASLGRPALDGADGKGGTGGNGTSGLTIGHEPDVLQVYRSTPMRLSVELPPAHRDALCAWSFGGGATPDDAPRACTIDHVFLGGTADERVSVVATHGAWSASATRIIPLERLPVSTRPVEAAGDPSDPAGAGDGLAKKPTGANSFRMVILADTADASAARLAAVARRIVALDADVVVHLGGHARDSQGWQALREGLAEGLRAADIPLLGAVSPADLEVGAEVRRPLGKGGEQLDLVDGAGFPERWSFSFDGVFMAFTSGGDQSAAALDWLRARLTEAQVYESRIVFSYLPLHPFGERVPDGPEPHTLGPKFKVYELLLRARTTALVTAGHAVYFKGRYGALPVVSVGAIGASGQRLLGHDVPQPSSLVVMDVARGLPERVFALVDGPAGTDAPLSRVLDEAYLPETVEVYTR